jgi:stage III sporulation protein AF
MMAEISAWVKSIVMVVLFATFLEFLLPASSMQRFVRVIMGLFIMLSILNPLINVLHSQILPEPVAVFGNPATRASEIERASQDAAKGRSQLTHEMYRKDLAKQIRALVMAVEGVAEVRVAVETNDEEGSKNIGAIKKIVLYVQPGLTSTNSKIKKVSIDTTNTAAADNRPELSSATRDKIQRVITELYPIREDQLTIQRLN